MYILWKIGFVFGLILFICYLIFRWTCGRCKCMTSLTGKTVLVTGGNTGIGYQVALNLAMRGARIIIADVVDASETVERIQKLTQNPNVAYKYLNLASFSSIRKCVGDILRTEDRLDVLINNAGISMAKQQLTEDGYNPLMQVNYLGPFLFTHLLVPLLRKNFGSGRIIFTSSCMVYIHDLCTTEEPNFKTLYDTPTFKDFLRYYANTKSFVLITSNEFAKRLKSSGITVNSLHPGWVYTPFIKSLVKSLHSSLAWQLSNLAHFIYAKSAEEGAQTTIHLAVNGTSHNNVTGEYFWDCRPFKQPNIAQNETYCRILWQITEKSVGLQHNEILQI